MRTFGNRCDGNFKGIVARFYPDHAIEVESGSLSAQGIDACDTITGMVNLAIEYSDKPVTPFGGMTLMKRFVDQTGTREHLAKLDLPHGGSNCACDPVHVIEAFWKGI